eukprot:g4596.t1
MSEQRVIVDKLNSPPFEVKPALSLVALDEKSGADLIRLFNTVLVKCDKSAHDVEEQQEEEDMRVFRHMFFLQTMRYKFPVDTDSFRKGLARGDRGVMYKLLHWALSNFEHLQKRSYLSKYLVPVEIPQEFLQDEAVASNLASLKQMQQAFKRVHKETEALRKGTQAPTELKREVTQLEDEKRQLREKIRRLQERTKGEPAFKELFAVTSALRKEQEEESRNAERMHEQQALLASTRQMLEEGQRRLEDARATAQGHLTAEELERNLEADLRASEKQREKLARESAGHRKALARMGRQGHAPRKTEADVAQLQMELKLLSEERGVLNEQISAAQAGDDQMATFRRATQALVRKLADKEDELVRARAARERARAEIDDREETLSALSGSAGYMKRAEFQSFAKGLKEKTALYKKLKAQLQAVEMEGTVVLSRTAQLLEGRDGNLGELLERLERKRGVKGYTQTEGSLRAVSERTADVNTAKAMTLEEISRVVAETNSELKQRKNKLAPQIKKLRAVRSDYQELEQVYLEKKAVFENMAVGLDTARMKLEKECDAFQDGCLAQESRYHDLQARIGIVDAQWNKVQEEMEFERKNGRLLRDFRTYQELYKHKIVQAEGMCKELRKQQKSVVEKEDGHLEQRVMFNDLRKLLACKLKTKQQAELEQYHDDTGAGNLGEREEMIGGANVMTLGD